MNALSGSKHGRISSQTNFKLSITPAQITNFKSLNKLKIKPKRKNQAGSISRRRKITLQAKFTGNGFLERVQQDGSHKPLIPNSHLKSLGTFRKFALPNAFTLKERKVRNENIKVTMQNPLIDNNAFEIANRNNEFKRRSSSLAVLSNMSKSKNTKLSINSNMQAFHKHKKSYEDPFLPLLYVPADVYHKNANQISKKSRSESRKNITNKVSRNPQKLLSTLSNKSIKAQKSLDEYELKAKKMYIMPHKNLKNDKLKTPEQPTIAIFAGFRTTKGYHPRKPDKPNQDRMLITSKFNNAKQQWVF